MILFQFLCSSPKVELEMKGKAYLSPADFHFQLKKKLFALHYQEPVRDSFPLKFYSFILFPL